MSNEDAPRQTTMCPRYKAQVNGDATGRTILQLSLSTPNPCMSVRHPRFVYFIFVYLFLNFIILK